MEFLKLENSTHIILAIVCIIISIYYIFKPEIQRNYEKVVYYIKYNFSLRFLRWFRGGGY